MWPFLAIVGDTWRQSKQQVVFLLLMGVMVLLSLGAILVPSVRTTEDQREILTFWFMDQANGGFEQSWDGRYREAVAEEQHHEARLRQPRSDAAAAANVFSRAQQRLARARLQAAPAKEQQEAEQQFAKAKKEYEQKSEALTELQKRLDFEAQSLVDQRAPGMTPLDKGVEVWLAGWSSLIFMISMWGFIAACAGYFPGMLRSGAVDVLVAKPISRHQIFFGKYVGGLALYTAALLGSYVLIFLGLGLRTGVWHLQFFSAIPLTVYAVALLYSLVAWVGVFTRRTALAIVVGYVFYFVVDTAIGALQSIGELRFVQGIAWLSTVSEWSRLLFPGFSRLKTAAAASVVNVPIFDWQPILVGAAWLTLLLATAYWRFRRLDF